MSFQIEPLKVQVDRLAKYILKNFSDYIDNNGACDVAIKIMEDLRNSCEDESEECYCETRRTCVEDRD